MQITLDTLRGCLYVSYLTVNRYFFHFCITLSAYLWANSVDTLIMSEGCLNERKTASRAAWISNMKVLLLLSHWKSIESLVIAPLMWHWIIPWYKILIYLKFPCVPIDELCTTRDGWRNNVPSLCIYIFLLSSCASVGRRQQEGCGCGVCLPAWLSAGATEKTNVWRETGRQAEFWWVLSRRGLGGKTEAGTWALHAEMRWLAAAWSGSFVHSAVSVWEICGEGTMKKSRYNGCFLT